MELIYSLLFGCLHKRYTFPIQRKVSGKPCGDYVVCLDCGQEFAYDWQRMRRIA